MPPSSANGSFVVLVATLKALNNSKVADDLTTSKSTNVVEPESLQTKIDLLPLLLVEQGA